jgi:hypothetical protein
LSKAFPAKKIRKSGKKKKLYSPQKRKFLMPHIVKKIKGKKVNKNSSYAANVTPHMPY